MKKLIAVFLAAALLASLTACGSAELVETVPATTEPAVTIEAPTEPVETEPASLYSAQSEIDIALRNADAPVLSLPSHDDYNEALRELGYQEVNFLMHVIGDERGCCDKEGNIVSEPIPSATVHNIQSLDNMVRMELSWYEHEDRYEEDGWVLYCTKADAVADISGIDVEYYDGCHAFSFSDVSEEWGTGFVEVWDYNYAHPNRFAVVQAYYYPESGNLYNLVKTYDYFPETAFAPRVLCKTPEDYMLGSD